MNYRSRQARALRVVFAFWLWMSPLAVARGQEIQGTEAQQPDENGKIQVSDEPGLVFDSKTKLHEWERENVTPLFPEGAKTKQDLGRLVRHERFPRGMASITLGPAAVAEARDYVARGLRGEVPLETVTFKPRSEKALFLQMAFGSKGNPDKIHVWDLALWAGDHDLVAWAIPLQSVNMRLLIPISCGNLAREPFRIQAEVKEECTGPWETEEISRLAVDDRVRIRVRAFRKDEQGRICDEFEHTIEVAKEFVDRPVEVPKPCPSCPPVQCDPEGWRFVVMHPAMPSGDKGYRGKSIKINRQTVSAMLDIRDAKYDPFMQENIRRFRETAVQRILGEVPEMVNEKTKLFFVFYNACTDRVRVIWYNEGWHWKEFLLGIPVGFIPGFSIGRALADCPEIIQKLPFFNPGSGGRPMTLVAGKDRPQGLPWQHPFPTRSLRDAETPEKEKEVEKEPVPDSVLYERLKSILKDRPGLLEKVVK